MTGWEQGRVPLAHQAFWRNASQTRPVKMEDNRRIKCNNCNDIYHVMFQKQKTIT